MRTSNNDDILGGGGLGGGDVGLGDSSTAESLVAGARADRDDFNFGDDRAITNPPNWEVLESEQLYNSAVMNNDPGSADAMGQSWVNHGSELQQIADELYEAIGELGGAWVGQASGAAQGSLVAIANSSQIAGDAARTMGKRMTDQAAAAAEVKKMPPPSDFNLQTALEQSLALGPAAGADLSAQKAKHDSILKQQQAYLDAYTKTMSEIDGTTPSFGPESIGLKPLESANAASRTVGGVGPGVGVGDGPSLADAKSRAAETIGAVQAQAAEHARGASGHPGAAANHALDQIKGQAGTASGPITATGHAAIQSTSGGPSAAGIGAAALGAGVGLAGARALSNRGRGGKAPQQTEQELAAAQAEAAAAEAAAAEEAAAQQAAANVAAADALAAANVPAPEVADGASAAASAEQAPGTVAASQQQGAPGAGGPQQHGGPAPAGAMPMGGAAGMPPAAPMAPMGPGGAGAGAGAAGGVPIVEDDHTPAKFLIDPDPDDMFGADEAVTPSVIGAFDDDE